MGLMEDKRGMYFTMITLLMITLFVTSYAFYSTVQERKIVEHRVETMDNFFFSAKEDLSRKVYVSGFRILFLVQKEIIETGMYVSDIESTFNEAFFNGTINNKSQELMIGATVEDIRNSLNFNANSINVNISLNNISLEITQEDPWYVKVSLKADIFMTDSSNLASWNKTEYLTSLVPIEGFEDPLYVVETQGLLINNITRTPYTEFIIDTDVTNLYDHLINEYYANTSLAPRYLDRLEGNMTPSEFGIESFVNLQKLSAQGVSVEEKSVVDHIYFSNSNPSSNQVSGMPAWFRLDEAHLEVYSS